MRSPAAAFELTAQEVAEAPLLGYRIADPGRSSAGLADSPGWPHRRRFAQPWLWPGEPTIDVDLIACLRPLGELFEWASVERGTFSDQRGALIRGVHWHGDQITAPPSPDVGVRFEAADVTMVTAVDRVLFAGHPTAIMTAGFAMSGFTIAGYHEFVGSRRELLALATRLPNDVVDLYFLNLHQMVAVVSRP